jgi:predicted AlkP superfamily pyrophosphatase or phosphodiesterase
MSRKLFLCLLAAAVCYPAARPAARGDATPASRRPKLVLTIVVDQFRYDYLTRFRASYSKGLARLLTQGAVFTNAYYDHVPTVTAIGHSTVLTGATPSMSGIVGNDWFERETGKRVTSVSDPTATLLGGSGAGSSPGRLLVSTVGDELKMALAPGPVKVIGVSLKDRAAILPAGHMADAAYWFDPASGNWVSSSYYFDRLPDWVEAVNRARPADCYLGREWKPADAKPGVAPFTKLSTKADKAFYSAIESSPFANDMIETFVEAAVTHEQLGRRAGATDLLSVSFSANDYVGHAFGPDSAQVRDVSIATDRVFGKLFDYLDKQIGMANILVVFTADHGVAPVPEEMARLRMPGGRLTGAAIFETIQNALNARFGEGKWIAGYSGPSPYFNRELIRQKGLAEDDVERVAADALRTLPEVFRAYTREQLRRGQTRNDLIDRRVENSFYEPRAPDVTFVLRPFVIVSEGSGTSHGAPFTYDSHVPIVFMGRGIRPGFYDRNVIVNDIAPTLATLLDVQIPAGSVGRVLDEALIRAPGGRP